LPVVFALDRSGLTGPEGPTHHGVFDVTYLRLFPNMTSMAPGDEQDLRPMLALALEHDGPISLRYPKTNLDKIERPNDFAPVEMGKAEVIEWGEDGCFIAYGTLLANCLAAARLLADEGTHVGVINARFVKPLDRDTILRAVESLPFVATVEEGTLEGGFGSAVLEAANAAGIDARNIVRLGIPDRFIEHGDRNELLAELGLNPEGLANAVRKHREAAVAP